MHVREQWLTIRPLDDGCDDVPCSCGSGEAVQHECMNTFDIVLSEVSKRGWRTSSFPIAPLGEGGHITGACFGLFLGVCLSPTPSRQPRFETSDVCELMYGCLAAQSHESRIARYPESRARNRKIFCSEKHTNESNHNKVLVSPVSRKSA